MSLIKVKEYLKKYNLDNKIIELDEFSRTVEEAAHALHTEGKRIAKTISLLQDNQVVLIVMAGDAKIDNSKYKQLFHIKAKMIPFDLVENLVGHAPGGVCPFGINEGIKVYLDESLKRFDTVFPACGSSNSAIELTIEELEETSNYESWIDVSKID